MAEFVSRAGPGAFCAEAAWVTLDSGLGVSPCGLRYFMLCGNKYKLNGEDREEYFDRFVLFCGYACFTMKHNEQSVKYRVEEFGTQDSVDKEVFPW